MKYIISILFLLMFNLKANEVTYQDLLDSASTNSFKLKLLESDENIESSKLDTVYADYYPTLNLSYNTEYNKDLNGFNAGTESVGDTVITNGTRYQSSLSLNLSYELYHFGVTDDSIEIAKREVDTKEYIWCEEEKRLHQNILERYSSAIKSDIKSGLKSQMLDIRQKIYEVKKRLYKAGKYSKVDLGDEAISIIDLEREVELSDLQYQEDIIELSKLSHVELDKETAKLLKIDFSQSKIIQDEFEETALGFKYSNQILQKEQEISQFDHAQYPTISMYGNYYMYGSDPEDVAESAEAIRKNSWKLGLSIRLNIFEGFKYSNNSQTLRHELLRIKQERDLNKREYNYNSKIKHNKISHLDTLYDKDSKLQKQTKKKIKMIKRLRKNRQIDSASELNALLEGLERELNLQIETAEIAYEKVSLDILHRGINECTQH